MSQVKKVCRVCEEEFTWRVGKPGYVDVCERCGEKDVPLLMAKVSWENKHTPVVEVCEAQEARRFNRQLARKPGGLIPALSESGREKARAQFKGERKSDQGARGYYRGKGSGRKF
jgi:hypothetical protein